MAKMKTEECVNEVKKELEVLLIKLNSQIALMTAKNAPRPEIRRVYSTRDQVALILKNNFAFENPMNKDGDSYQIMYSAKIADKY